mgnify:CR=1 FL=1
MRQLPRGYSIHILFARGIERVSKNSEVWIVDDDASIRWVLERALVDAGLSVREFGDIDEAMRVMGPELPNVVITDINEYRLDLAKKLGEQALSRTIGAAFGFLIVGISLKLALFPLHLWLPNAYTYAPSVVSAFLAATATKVAVYVLLRFIFTIFNIKLSFGVMPLDTILLVLAVIAMFAGSAVAIFQPNLKRMLAYSSVAQIGYIILGLSLIHI